MNVDFLSSDIRLSDGIYDKGSDYNSYDNSNDSDTDNSTYPPNQKPAGNEKWSKLNILVISC